MNRACTCGCHQVTWDEFYVHVVPCCDKTNVSDDPHDPTTDATEADCDEMAEQDDEEQA